MATYELIALNETTKKLLAPTSADTGSLAGALSVGGAGSFTGRITSTHVNDWILYNSGASTGFKGIVFGNTSGEGKFGIEGGVGGTIVTGSTAYATVLGSAVSKPVEFFTNDAIRLTITAGGNVTITTGDLIITTPTTPASAAATGTVGTIAWDTNYIYVCTATDTWERVAIASW